MERSSWFLLYVREPHQFTDGLPIRSRAACGRSNRRRPACAKCNIYDLLQWRKRISERECYRGIVNCSIGFIDTLGKSHVKRHKGHLGELRRLHHIQLEFEKCRYCQEHDHVELAG